MRKVIDTLFDVYTRVGVAMLLTFLGCALALFASVLVAQIVTFHVPEAIMDVYAWTFAISLAFLFIHVIGGALVDVYKVCRYANQWIVKQFA